MGYIQQETIDKINSRADLLEVIGSCVELKKQGVNYVAPCPFHKEKSASFVVSPAKGMYHCFGCGEGGRTAIKFLQKFKHITFQESCRELAHRYNIEIEEERPSAEVIAKRKKKKDLLDATKTLQQFFFDQLWPRDDKGNLIEPKTGEAKAARDYVERRWGRELAESFGIGYAPSPFGCIPAVAAKNEISYDILKISDDDKTLGIIYQGKDDKWGGTFRDRVMIPLHDENGDVRGWSGRTMGNDKAKYKNSTNCEGFMNKSEYIFNYYIARPAAMRVGKLYLVEGAPNVLRCMLVGQPNTVASNGGEWTDAHMEKIAKMHVPICFIPDSDLVKDKNDHLHPVRVLEGDEMKFGAGFNKVIKAAKKALKLGVSVSVKPLPFEDAEGHVSSRDADDYFSSELVFEQTSEVAFVEWFADIAFDSEEKNARIRLEMLKRIAEVVALVKDDNEREQYIHNIEEKFGKPKMKMLRALVKDKRKDLLHEQIKEIEGEDESTFELFGFTAEGTKGYFGTNADGKRVQWSNFIARPKYLVKDADFPRRIFELENFRHEKEMLDISIEAIVSLVKFKTKCKGLGNFIWMKGQAELDRVKSYWYNNTENAFLVTQLGWQKRGFYAYGNGGLFEGSWFPANEEGMIKLPMENGMTENFYIPAASSQYKNDKSHFEFEKNFVYIPEDNAKGVTFNLYCRKMRSVFGDKAMIGISFLCASCFYDIVTRNGRKMPLLNLFGPKGSGKSQFADFLTAFFTIGYKAPHINETTVAALSNAIGRVANSVVHIDEFRNDIDVRRREMLKSVWDGKGRERMSMEREKGSESTSVESGVIVSGQEMATADIALFSRMVFLTFEKSQFSREEKERFQELKDMADLGVTHLSREILEHRDRFEARFPEAYSVVKDDVCRQIDMTTTENRIVDNWIMPLAAYRALEGLIDFPFGYKEILDTTIDGIKFQNSTSSTNNEIGKFWDMVMSFFTGGQIYDKADFKICIPKKPVKVRFDGQDCSLDFSGTKRLLYLQTSQVFQEYKKTANQGGDTSLAVSSLPYYLEHSPEFLGKVRTTSFWKMDRKRGEQEQIRVPNGDGTYSFNGKTIKTSCLLFDYDALVNHYGLNLEVFGRDSINPDESEAIPEDEQPF